MRQIIGGRMYDTDKAQLVGSVFSDNFLYIIRNFTHLYKTDDGVYFFYEQEAKKQKDGQYIFVGDKLSACRDGHGEITLIPEIKARRWAEENLTIDEYLKAFTLNNDIPKFDENDNVIFDHHCDEKRSIAE